MFFINHYLAFSLGGRGVINSSVARFCRFQVRGDGDDINYGDLLKSTYMPLEEG